MYSLSLSRSTERQKPKTAFFVWWFIISKSKPTDRWFRMSFFQHLAVCVCYYFHFVCTWVPASYIKFISASYAYIHFILNCWSYCCCGRLKCTIPLHINSALAHRNPIFQYSHKWVYQAGMRLRLQFVNAIKYYIHSNNNTIVCKAIDVVYKAQDNNTQQNLSFSMLRDCLLHITHCYYIRRPFGSPQARSPSSLLPCLLLVLLPLLLRLLLVFVFMALTPGQQNKPYFTPMYWCRIRYVRCECMQCEIKQWENKTKQSTWKISNQRLFCWHK